MRLREHHRRQSPAVIEHNQRAHLRDQEQITAIGYSTRKSE
jgi:hypothetical protein